MIAQVLAYAGVALSIVGMMLVIAGVIAAGLFLPGVVILAVGMLAFAAAGLVPALHKSRRD